MRGAGAPPITSLGVHEFLKNEVRLEEADIVGIQVDIPLKKVWVKFVAEDLCFDVVQHGRYEFKHGNGEISIVRAQGAGRGSRLVRVFRLPFEVSNLKLSAELSKYGKVIGGVQDERFDDKHVFKVRTGVRRARVEISQHIPSYITVDNQKCLVMYAGQPATCGICNLPGHLRKQCPEKGKPKSFSAALRGADDGENMDETEIDCSLYVDQGGYGTAEPTSSGTSPLTQGQPAARGPAGEQQHGTAQQEDGDTPREQRLHLEEAAVETVPTAAAGDGPPGGPSGRPARFVFDSNTLADGALKIMSLNVCTISAQEKLEAVRHVIRREKADIVCLQEVRAPFLGVPGFKEITNVGTAGRGTAVLVRDNLDMIEERRLPSGRATAVKVSDVTIVNIYAPAGSQGRQERAKFFTEDLALLLADLRDQVVFVGDFNAVIRPQDTTGTAAPCAILRNVVSAMRLEDAWLQLKPEEQGFTYVTNECSSRLDRLYLSKELTPGLRGARLISTAVSDHLALLVEVELPAARRAEPDRPHQGQWKLDPALLSSKGFLARLQAVWENWKQKKNQYDDVITWWEEGKGRLRSFCAARTREVRKDDESLLKFFHDCLAELHAGRVDNPTNAADERVAYFKRRIMDVLRRRLLGVAARAKCSTPCQDEPPAVHHVAAGIRRIEANTIESLQDAAGQVFSGQAAIEAHVREYFEEVFRELPGESDKPTPLLDAAIEGPVLDDQDNTNLLAEITEAELLEAIKACPRSKSPGEDGLTAELYLVAWDILGKDMLAAFNTMMQRRQVADSHTKGVMVLIPKVKEPVTVKDFRPVTLLDVDGKILSRILARRLEKVQDKLLHPLQVRGGGGRTMHAALADIRDCIAVVDTANRQPRTKVGACLVALDIAGAFNNVTHQVIWEILRRYGVGADFITLIMSMYRKATTCVRINGSLTPPFVLGRGVRQGCPLSMVIFNVVMSVLIRVLACRLRGISIPDVRGGGAEPCLAVSAYVDDVIAVLERPEDAAALATALRDFGEETGLKVNNTKSKALPLGAWGHQVLLPFPYVQEVKVLGIVFTASVHGMAAANWTSRVGALRATLADARLRAFNIAQRVEYANTYAMSLLWHLAQVIPISMTTAKDVRKALGKFLWAGELLRVPFEVMILPKALGGLGLHDPLHKSRAMFVARWMTAERAANVSLSGGWLRILGELHPHGTALPMSVRYMGPVRDVVAEGKAPPVLAGKDLTKAIYNAFLADAIAKPRVCRLNGDADWPLVWRRVHSALLPAAARATWFRVAHDVLPTRARLAAINWVDSPLCLRCDDVGDDLLHHLLGCGRERRAIWAWAATKLSVLLGLDPVPPNIVIRPDFGAPSRGRQDAAVIILGTMVHFLASNQKVRMGDFLAVMKEEKDRAIQSGDPGLQQSMKTL
ncbi:Transposon TX1 uncharacterized 149 kDa protein [Frankliniella fusca]|uniref:Transposon TX1 uncharacterized 149 kDa protein n=1 Tax=Frankliniella fusca TaxID=407009 RepID=A0AAE1L6T8_9NEOP|nr:Transposon TX1 uncharacterized 149 kDa protein [Frankliniella fusca]